MEGKKVVTGQTKALQSEETKKNQEKKGCDEISEEEQSKIVLMRDLVEKQDPKAKEVGNLMLRRFLRARDKDVVKASAMFLKFLKWKHEFIPNDLAQNKQFLQGLDKQGRPITVIFGGRHFPNKIGGVDEFKRFVAFALEKLCSSMPGGQEKFVVIGDHKGWGYSNCDVRGYLAALSILQDYYPERLGKLFIVHVPYIFMKTWKIVYPFIYNNTKKKVRSESYDIFSFFILSLSSQRRMMIPSFTFEL